MMRCWRGKHRRARIIIITVLLGLLSLLGIIALLGYHPGNRREEHPGNSGEEHPGNSGEEHPGNSGEEHPGNSGEEHPGNSGEEHPGNSGDSGDSGAPTPADYNVSGWIEQAGLEDDSSLAAASDAGPNGTLLPAGPFRYIINQANVCPEGEAPPFLVLLITVEAHQVERRDAIRRTWGQEGSPGGPRVVRLFLLGAKKEEEGEPRGRRLQRTLESESLRHGDILQQDFMDTYRNLTVKTLMGLNWVARHCPRAGYVMKTDSDVFVNTEYLVRELLRPDVKPRKKLFTGLLRRGTGPIRYKGNKWYVSEEEYPSETYPDFCTGMGYVFSGDLATEIYGASLSVPRLSLEDVYVGMCLDRLGIRIAEPPNEFQFYPVGLRPFDRDRYSHLVASHSVTPTEMLDYWHRLHPGRPAPLGPPLPATARATNMTKL